MQNITPSDSPTRLDRSSSCCPKTASWLAITAISAGAFALITAEFLPVGLLPLITNDLAISEGQAGLMITGPGVVAAISAMLTITLARNLDRRYLLCSLLSLLVVSNVLVAWATDLYTLLFGRLVLGVAVGGFWTIGVSVGPRLRPDAPIRATSIIFLGVTIGSVVGVPAGTLLGGLLGWRMAFGIYAGLVALIVLALLCLLPAITPERLSGVGQVPAVLRMRKVQVGLVAVVLVFTGQFSAYTYVTPLLSQSAGFGSGGLSAVLLAYGAAGIVGNIVCSRIVESSVRHALFATCLLLGGALVLLIFSMASAAATVLAMVAWGLGFGMLPIAIQNWIFRAAPDRLETVVALFVSITQLAIGAGALVGGYAVDHHGLFGATWLGVIGAFTAALWVYITFPRHA